MKKLLLSAIMAVAALSAANAQSLSSCGFEPKEKWVISEACQSGVSITTEKSFEGKQSLKFDCQDFGELKMFTANQGKSKKGKGLNLTAGEYTVKAMVFVGKTSPATIGLKIRNKAKGGTKMVSERFKLKGVKHGEWVEVSNDFTIEGNLQGAISLSVSSDAKKGGKGVVYIDQLTISKK